MKKFKIFIWHLIVFIAGSIGIVVYIFIRLSSPASKAGLGGIIIMIGVCFTFILKTIRLVVPKRPVHQKYMPKKF